MTKALKQAGWTAEQVKRLTTLGQLWNGEALPYDVFITFVRMFTSCVTDVAIMREGPRGTEVLMYPRPKGEKQFVVEVAGNPVVQWYLPGRSVRHEDGKTHPDWPLTGCLARLEREVFGFTLLEKPKLAGLGFAFSDKRGVEVCFVYVATLPIGTDNLNGGEFWPIEGIEDRPELIQAQLHRIQLARNAFVTGTYAYLPTLPQIHS